MLGDIKSGDEVAKGSATGLVFGWLGAIAGVVLVMPVASSLNSRPGALLFAWILCAAVTVPALWKFSKIQNITDVLDETPTAIPQPSSNNICSFIKEPLVGLFLVACLFYLDALFTIQDNLSLFLGNGLYLKDSDKSAVALGVIVFGIVGASLSRIGVTENGLLKRLTIWVVLAALFTSLVGSGLPPVSISLLLVLFLVQGGVLSLSRALMTKLVPANKRGIGFAAYSVIQRTGTLVAPILWGWFLHIRGKENYATAFQCMAALMFIGFLILLRLKAQSNKQSEEGN